MNSNRMRFIKGVSPDPSAVRFTFEGAAMEGFAGESIASALMLAGRLDMRRSPKLKQPRGYYCGMGICWECAIRVEGLGVVRGCSTPLSAGMVLELADEVSE